MNEKLVDCASAIGRIKYSIEDKLDNHGINLQNAILSALKIPGVKINRSKFLRKELYGFFSEETIQKAIDVNPAYAGVSKEFIDTVSKKVIAYETNKVSAISFAAGIPGGVALFATIPADVAQYFGFMIRIMQKLAYLYGFDDFELNEENIKDDTMNQLLIFLGVMFGVEGANTGVKILAESAAKRIAKVLPNKALTKTTIYPIVKKIALNIGIKMNKNVFAQGVSKIVPVVGGVITGGMTYATFKPSAYCLKKSFENLPLCNPNSDVILDLKSEYT